MNYVEPISNRACKTQADADSLHAEIVRRQDIILRSSVELPDAERAALYRQGVGVSPVEPPKSYPRVTRGGAAVAEPPSISVVPANHVVKRRRKFRLW